MPVSTALNVNVDVIGIAKAIEGSIKSGQNRDGFVKNLMESTFHSAGRKYNVMVFNLSQEYDERFKGVQFYASANYDSVIYGIWAFESGEFINKGDGGYINWAFKGSFNRHGDQGHHVTFR